MIVIRGALVLGAEIRRHRKRHKLTQADLGKRVGVRQATVSAFENGRGGSLETLFALLAALGLDVVLQDRGSALADFGDL